MTLISTIADSIAAVTWDMADHSLGQLFWGSILNKYGLADYVSETDYQNDLATYSGYFVAGLAEYMAQLRGIYGSALTAEIRRTLAGMTMLSHVPKNFETGGVGYFISHRYGAPYLYRCAKTLNCNVASWDSGFAWQEAKQACVDLGHGFRYFNPVTGTEEGASNRFYDENCQSLRFLMDLYLIDPANNADAFTYARDTLWAYINSYHWSVNHYDYQGPAWTGYECSGGVFAVMIGALRAVNGYSLTNWDRILTDIKARFLNSGWDSPQWTFGATKYYAVVHHHDSTSQRRLPENLSSWIALHAYYQLLDSASQTAMTTLLDGATKAWEYLVSATPALYDNATKLFKHYSGEATSEWATALGIVTLFLLGIVPQTGSLYVPLCDFSYTEVGLNDYFLFDYTNRKVRIPVKAGSIKFIYGASSVTYTFLSDGVYELNFNAAWTLIDKVKKIRNLDSSLAYVAEITEYPKTDNSLFKNLAAAFRKSRGAPSLSVTRHALYLEGPDAVTDWFLKAYRESMIDAVIVPKTSQGLALQAGYFVSLDALGFTQTVVRTGDLWTDGAGRRWEVKTVVPATIGDTLYFYQCDLKELPLNG